MYANLGFEQVFWHKMMLHFGKALHQYNNYSWLERYNENMFRWVYSSNLLPFRYRRANWSGLRNSKWTILDVRNATGNPNARYGWSCSQSHVCQRITLKLYAGIQLSRGLKHVAFHVLGHLKQRMHTSLGKETECTIYWQDIICIHWITHRWLEKGKW